MHYIGEHIHSFMQLLQNGAVIYEIISDFVDHVNFFHLVEKSKTKIYKKKKKEFCSRFRCCPITNLDQYTVAIKILI